MTDTTNALPPVPAHPWKVLGWDEREIHAIQQYGDARAAHAVAQCPHALKEKIRSAEARIAELEAQIKASEVTDAEIEAGAAYAMNALRDIDTMMYTSIPSSYVDAREQLDKIRSLVRAAIALANKKG